MTRRRRLTALTELSVTSALCWRRSRREEIQSDREQIDSLRGEREGPRSCDPEAELLLLLYWIKLHSDWMKRERKQTMHRSQEDDFDGA